MSDTVESRVAQFLEDVKSLEKRLNAFSGDEDEPRRGFEIYRDLRDLTKEMEGIERMLGERLEALTERVMVEVINCEPSGRYPKQPKVLGPVTQDEVASLLEDAESLEKLLDILVTSGDDKHRKGTEIHGKLFRARKKLNDMEERNINGSYPPETLRECRERFKAITERVLIEVFNFDAEKAQEMSDPLAAPV